MVISTASRLQETDGWIGDVGCRSSSTEPDIRAIVFVSKSPCQQNKNAVVGKEWLLALLQTIGERQIEIPQDK